MRGAVKSQNTRIAISLIAIAVIMLGVYLIFTKRIPFIHGYQFSANFASSNQLVPGFSPVRIAGVTVGKVVKIEPGPGDTTKVTMEVKDNALPIHQDARVRIRPRLFLEGGFAVELQPGSAGAPVLDDGEELPSGSTAGPVQLHQILAAFDRSTRTDLRSLVAEFDKSLDNGGAEALGKTWEPLSPVLRDVAIIAEAARGVKAHDASDIVTNAAKVVGTLADREQALRGLVRNLNVTTTALASRDAELAGTVREAAVLLREAPPQLDRINATLPTVNRFIDETRPVLRALPPVLDHAVPVLDQGRALVQPSELPALVSALGPTVRLLGPLEDELVTLFPKLTTVTDCLREKALPVLLAEVPDGQLSTGRPAWQDLAHAFVGLASATQNFDGNGFSIRYTAGAGETSVGTGNVPGLGTLTGTAAEPIQGSRPRYLGPGQRPDFHPEAPCMEQAVADLSQRSEGGGPVPPAGRQVDLSDVPVVDSIKEASKMFERHVDELPSPAELSR